MTGDRSQGGDFWSRRKEAVRQSEERQRTEAASVELAQQRADLETKSDAEILQELELPDPDTLTDKDDFRQFLSEAIPERLRRRALRRLWSVNPVLANLDGLVEYAEDYTDAATVVENMQTVYQVGKGMFDRFAEVLDSEGDVEADLPEPGEEQEVANNDAVQEGWDTAAHNGYDEDGEAFVQLTQADVLMQDDVLYDKAAALEGTTAAEDYEIPLKRRRMRFDYS